MLENKRLYGDATQLSEIESVLVLMYLGWHYPKLREAL